MLDSVVGAIADLDANNSIVLALRVPRDGPFTDLFWCYDDLAFTSIVGLYTRIDHRSTDLRFFRKFVRSAWIVGSDRMTRVASREEVMHSYCLRDASADGISSGVWGLKILSSRYFVILTAIGRTIALQRLFCMGANFRVGLRVD
jgi:hypothetical protein